jgi:hypothetical protein
MKREALFTEIEVGINLGPGTVQTLHLTDLNSRGDREIRYPQPCWKGGYLDADTTRSRVGEIWKWEAGDAIEGAANGSRTVRRNELLDFACGKGWAGVREV